MRVAHHQQLAEDAAHAPHVDLLVVVVVEEDEKKEIAENTKEIK